MDSIDLCYSKEHIDTFVIVSGDSDFSPLVSKLKENGKRVIGLGMKESSSNLLIDNCDEFIYYEDLERPVGTPPRIEQDLPEKKKEAFQLLVDSVVALVRENKEVLWSSLVKETMKRKKPSFNESYHGYRTFSDLLEDAEKEGIIRLRTDSRSGTYVITGFGKEQRKGEKEELKVMKERKTQKPRTTQKPHWRPRQRRPKTHPSSHGRSLRVSSFGASNTRNQSFRKRDADIMPPFPPDGVKKLPSSTSCPERTSGFPNP